MQGHSEIGEAILKKVDLYADVARIVRHHHERIDGEGYPDEIAGDEIPLLSKIIAVADAYNAMTSDRPYRDAMPSRVARLRLAQAVESQFDTSASLRSKRSLREPSEEYRTAKRADFEPISARCQLERALGPATNPRRLPCSIVGVITPAVVGVHALAQAPFCDPTPLVEHVVT